MDKDNLSLLLIGMGAIGGVTAGFIKTAGYNIQAVCKYPDLAHHIQTKGIHVIGVRGEFHTPMPAVASVKELKNTYDIIFLAVKTPDLMKMVADIKPLLKPTSSLVVMENGIIEDRLGEIFGAERVVGCIVG